MCTSNTHKNWEVQTDTNKVTHTTFSTFIIAGKKEFITVDLTVYLRKKKKADLSE